MLSSAALFLDRDGVLNFDRPDYVRSLSQFRFIPGAIGAVRHLSGLGVPVVVVTNQSQIGRGVTPSEIVDEINAHMVRQIELGGGRIAAVYMCPHAPLDDCQCRKPRPGLLLQAAADLQLDLTASVMVGDRPTDEAAAHAAGCRFIGVGEQHWASDGPPSPPRRAVAPDLAAAVSLIEGVFR